MALTKGRKKNAMCCTCHVVGCFEGSFCLFNGIHVGKAKAFALMCHAIVDEMNALNLSELAEQVFKVFFACILREAKDAKDAVWLSDGKGGLFGSIVVRAAASLIGRRGRATARV
jgi:hypothetical protein